MKVGDLVKLSPKGCRSTMVDDVRRSLGLVTRIERGFYEWFYIKWGAPNVETIHFRYELRFARWK
jgi:hypothetical protein